MSKYIFIILVTLSIVSLIIGNFAMLTVLILFGVMLFLVSKAETKESFKDENDVSVILNNNKFKLDGKSIRISPKTGIIIIIILAGVMFSLAKISSNSQISNIALKKFDTNDFGDKIDLHIQAQQYILQGLKSPSTAKFPAFPYEIIDMGNGKYKVVSYVDSQNSFGAMLRSDWSVVMKISGGLWTPERMVIGGEVVYQSKEDKQQAVPSKRVNTKAQTAYPPVSKVVPTEQPKTSSTSDKIALFGEKVKLSDKNIIVYSVGEYVAKYDTPRDGYWFIYVDAEIENLTDEDLSCAFFDLTDDKGKEYERGYIGLGNDLENCITTISPYKKARGYSIFEVPKTREYFQVKYANVFGNIKIDPLHIIFKPNPGLKLESRMQN